MPTQDQVVWANCNVLVGEALEPFSRGVLLPEVATQAESANRQTLRLVGAIRAVEVVYTEAELAAAAGVHAQANADRAVARDVDPAAPMGDQVTGGVTAGAPTLESPGQTPVVIGPEPVKAPAKTPAKEPAKEPAAKEPAKAPASKG
jgi:hypothetical protein